MKLAMTDWKEAEKIIQTNYVGAVSILNIIAEDYAAKQKGTIVGISSVAGERGRQSNYIYGSAKAGFTAYFIRIKKQNVSIKSPCGNCFAWFCKYKNDELN